MAYNIRPLSFAEILDRSFRIIVDKPVVLIGISVIPLIPERALESFGRWGAIAALILLMTVGPLLHAALTTAITEIYLDRPVTIESAYRSGWFILFPFFGTYLLIYGAALVGVIVFAVLAGLTMVAGANNVLPLVFILGGLVGTPLWLYVVVRWSLIGPVMIVERRFGLSALLRSRDLVEETVALIKGDGGRALAVTGDAATEADVQTMIAAGVKAFGKLDVLVNNAGDGGPTKRVQEYTTDDWFYTINSCLTTSYMCTRFAVPEMIKAGGGVIVNITSTAGRRGLPYRIGYCSAKAGQVGMTYGLALELSPLNIRVNAIAPGAVEGDRIDRVIAGQAEVRGVAVEDMRRNFVERAPLKRMTTAEDIATLAVYLCSDAAKNLSGQCIAVTAGEPAV